MKRKAEMIEPKKEKNMNIYQRRLEKKPIIIMKVDIYNIFREI